MTTLTKNELLGLTALVTENRDSAKLQKISDIGYIDSINLKVKLLEMISDIEKSEWAEKQKDIYDISYDYDSEEMVIKDNQNDVEYRIHRNLVDNVLVAQYHIVNAESEADELETLIPEAKCESTKELMREDLETLRECEDEFAIGYYGTNGFVTKESDIEEFNKICLEIIESYQELCYSVTVSDIKWDFEDENYEDYDGPANEIVKHYWILPSTLEANTLEEAKEEIEEIISERLSDEEGYCHDGFEMEVKNPQGIKYFWNDPEGLSSDFCKILKWPNSDSLEFEFAEEITSLKDDIVYQHNVKNYSSDAIFYIKTLNGSEAEVTAEELKELN